MWVELDHILHPARPRAAPLHHPAQQPHRAPLHSPTAPNRHTQQHTLAGASATESYTAKGLDLSTVYLPKESSVFVKAGIHSSEVAGTGSITIGGTTYAANASYSGTGILIGAGFQFDNSRVGLTYYGDIGGNSKANSTVAYLGYRF